MKKISIFSAIVCILSMIAVFSPGSLKATGLTLSRNLRIGSQGADVTALQQFLNSNPATMVATAGDGSPGNETNYFGKATYRAVVNFQNLHLTALNIPQGTGYVGPLTRSLISEVSDTNSVSNPVAINSNSPITPVCSPSPSPAQIGQTVTWAVYVPAGVATGTLTYSWSGDEGLTGTTQTVQQVYKNPGTERAAVTVMSGNSGGTAHCILTSTIYPTDTTNPVNPIITSNPNPNPNPTSNPQPPTIPRLILGTSTYSIQPYLNQSWLGVGWGIDWGANLVSTTRNGNSYTQTYSNGWSITMTPTEDVQNGIDGIHFVAVATNNGSGPQMLPPFKFAQLGPDLTQWSNWEDNLSEPAFVYTTMSDGTYVGFRMDDPTYANTIEMRQINGVGTGIVDLNSYADGGNYRSYYPYPPVIVQPGQSTTLRASVLFGSNLNAMQAPAWAAWNQQFPYALTWTDKRMILRDDISGFSNLGSPQGWFDGLDTSNSANWAQFDTDVMARAASLISIARANNAQGVIEWDIEGHQFSNYAYYGNPEIAETLNPVWDHTDASGQKLIDRFFAAFKAAGLNVGVCIRPWTLTASAGGISGVNNNVAATTSIENHIDFAHTRWGANIFYADSVNYYAVADYRSLFVNRHDILVINEDVLEPFFQFSTSLLFDSTDNINYPVAPRQIYSQDWGFHYDNSYGQPNYNDPATAARILGDVRQGSGIMVTNGWWATDPQMTGAKAIYDAAGGVSKAASDWGNLLASVYSAIDPIQNVWIPNNLEIILTKIAYGAVQILMSWILH